MSTGPVAPTVTRTRSGLPACRTVTKAAAPMPSTADVGTVTASPTLARVIATWASEPAKRVGASAASPIVTG